MFIEFHNDFCSLKSSELMEYIVPISNLLEAHANGWHFLSGDRNLFQKVKGLSGLSSKQAAAATRIMQNFPYSQSIRDVLEFRILVYDPRKMDCVKNEFIHCYDISRFSVADRLQPPHVLVEDSRYDAYILGQILNAYLSADMANSLCRVQYRHCGGSGYEATLQDVIREERPFICVVDSDKQSPFSIPGETAQVVLDSFGKHRQNQEDSVSILLQIPAREIENLIPPKILDTIWALSFERQARINILKQIFKEWPILKSEDFVRYLYFDLKRGIEFDKNDDCHSEAEKIFLNGYVVDGLESVPGLSETLIQEIIRAVESPRREKCEKDRLVQQAFKEFLKNSIHRDLAAQLFSFCIHNSSRL